MSFIFDNIIFILAMIFLALFVWFWISYRKVAHKKWITPTEAFPADWRRILNVEVSFYQTLDQQEKARFELKVQEFLLNCKITGVKTAVSMHDKLLVASSAVIPIFRFDNWRYTNIREVLLYPTTFDHNFQFEDEASERIILGMVGSHNMEGLMILSKEALELGFKNETDKHNTAIHEFVHLIDKSDSVVDGVPQLLLERQYTIPWLHIMKTEIERIQKGKSDINPYAATNNAEFFAVASEYFFERPELLEDKHPELYQVLEKVFSKRKF